MWDQVLHENRNRTLQRVGVHFYYHRHDIAKLLLCLCLGFDGLPGSAADQVPLKPVITVLSVRSDTVQQSFLEIARDQLTSALIETQQYVVVDRADVDLILTEQSLSLSGILADNDQIRVGKMLSTDFVVTGFITLVSGRYSLSVKKLNVESGEIVELSTSDYEDLQELQRCLRGVAFKLGGDDAILRQCESELRKAREARKAMALRDKKIRVCKSSFSPVNNPWILDLDFGIGTGRYPVTSVRSYEWIDFVWTPIEKIEEIYSYFGSTSLALGYNVFDHLAVYAVTGGCLEMYYSYYDLVYDLDQYLVFKIYLLLAMRVSIGDISDGFRFVGDIGYLKTDKLFGGLYYSLGCGFKAWHLTLSLLPGGFFTQVGYSFRL
jgi:hypothetical protein